MSSNPVISRIQRLSLLLAVALSLLACQLFSRIPQTSVEPSSTPRRPVSTQKPAATLPPPVQKTAPAAPTLNSGGGEVEALEYLYSQDFSTPPPEWNLDPYQNDSVTASYEVKDGVYRWKLNTAKGVALWNLAEPALMLPQGDFLYTVTIDFGSTTQTVSAGLIFRLQDDANFYFAKMTNTGQVSVFVLQNNSWQKLVEPTQSDHFAAQKSNRLIVQQKAGTYEVQVNDYPVFTFTDNRYTAGKAGLIVDLEGGIQTDVTFDDVRIMQPTGSGAAGNEPVRRPTIMSLGASYQTLTEKFNGVPFSIDHPFVFVPSQSGDWQQLCLDAPEVLCVIIKPAVSTWANAQDMAEDVITGFRSSVGDYQELHSQSKQTVDGLPAYWVGYTCTRQGVELEGSRMFVVAQGIGFDIAFEGEPVMMDVYRTVVKLMLESFRLKEY